MSAFRGTFFDFDPITGLTEYYEDHGDGRVSIHTYQDVEPFVDAAKRMANSGSADEAWRKSGATLYAIIPPAVQGLMLQKGIKMFDPNHAKDVFREVNTNYPYLKTTHKHHELKR